MIPKEVLRKIRKIHITTSRMVTDVFAGQYHSVFKGRGIEFDEVREYIPGDDIRAIDWNVTARMGHPYVKKYVEERELTVMLALDASMSSRFGSARQLKNQVAAEICSLLALSAVNNNDKVGLIVFTDRIEKFVPPRKGLRHVLRVIRESLYSDETKGSGTDISLALQYLNRVTKRRAIVFLISDFFDTGFERLLRASNRRHDIIAVPVTDLREAFMPDVGMVELEDAETGGRVTVDTSDAAWRRDYETRALERKALRRKLLGASGVDAIEVTTYAPYTGELIRFFKLREKRMA